MHVPNYHVTFQILEKYALDGACKPGTDLLYKGGREEKRGEEKRGEERRGRRKGRGKGKREI